jgi:hypothetical protein
MPARTKNFHEKTELTQEREISSHPWSMIFDSDSELLFRKASDSTLRAFLAILPYMRKGDPPGFLSIKTSELAHRTGLPQKQIGDCLRKLDTLDILKRKDGVYYYPKMSAFFRNSNRRRAKNENDEKPRETAENDDSSMANIHERGSQNEGSNRIEDKISLNTTSGSILNSSSLNNNIREGKGSGASGVAGAPQNPDLVPLIVDIDSAFRIPSAKFSAVVTKTWLAGVKARADFKPLADRFDQIVFDCVTYWATRGDEIKPGAIINSLNHAIGKSADQKTTKPATTKQAPAEVKAPTPEPKIEPAEKPKPRYRI